MIKTLAEAEMAAIPALKEYLKENGIPFEDKALRDDLLDLVRGKMIESGEVPNVDANDKPEAKMPASISTMSAVDALRLLQSRGFPDAAAAHALLEVIQRETKMAETQKNALKATIDDIEQREIHMAAREKALEEKAGAVQKDMIEQKGIYERLSKLRTEMKAEGANGDAIV